jgi:hypothetical protein
MPTADPLAENVRSAFGIFKLEVGSEIGGPTARGPRRAIATMECDANASGPAPPRGRDRRILTAANLTSGEHAGSRGRRASVRRVLNGRDCAGPKRSGPQPARGAFHAEAFNSKATSSGASFIHRGCPSDICSSVAFWPAVIATIWSVLTMKMPTSSPVSFDLRSLMNAISFNL